MRSGPFLEPIVKLLRSSVMDKFGISNLLPRVSGTFSFLDHASQLRRIRVTAGFREGKNVFKNNDIVELERLPRRNSS